MMADLEPYELFVFILGDSPASQKTFSITVTASDSVGTLKDRVHTINQNRLKGIDPSDLILWKLKVPIPGDQADARVAALPQNLSEFALKMAPMNKLAFYFPLAVERRCIHIIAVCPSPTTPPNRLVRLWLSHTPLKNDEELRPTIAGIFNEYRPQMQGFLKEAQDMASILPSWTPKFSTNTKLSEHISELRIPTVSGGQPSLLLHDLGQERDDLDRDRVERIPTIFSFSHHTVLINTSGSGKTRLLLEGLCRRWGFYFVARPDMTGIGSEDLWDVIKGLSNATDYHKAKGMKDNGTDAEAKAAFEHIREVAERRLCQLLLARFLLLNLFVQEARKLPRGLREKEHRRLWVLLQVEPKIFGSGVDDIFATITELLRHADADALRSQIRRQFRELSDLRQEIHNPDITEDEIPPYFCVLDEAQITTTERLGDFISNDNSTKRPILREIWLTWSTILRRENLRLVLSGTGVDQQVLQDTLSSSVCKPRSYHVMSDIGAFDSPEAQAKYIKRYLPAPWSEPQWMEFLTRAWIWLRGRYRYTATLISLILAAGYQCPHTAITNMPTDRRFANSEPELQRGFILKDMITKLDFDKMNKMQLSTLSDVIYDQVIYGHYTLGAFTSAERDAFVEHGFARHTLGIDKTVLDEPLAILAAFQWLDRDPAFSVSECLRRDIGKYSPGRNGFEAYLAFHLRKRFETTPKLDAVFTFRGDFAKRSGTDLVWQHEEFELVTVVTMAERDSPTVSVVTPSSGPSSNIGFSADRGEQVLEWISTNSGGFAFCFPPIHFGPDLLFFIRSKQSQKLLLVMIQAKHYNHVEKQEVIRGVRTVTPSWLWKSTDTQYSTADDAPFLSTECGSLAAPTETTLANIPLGLTVDNAAYPVLRVFASWPGEARLRRTLGRKKYSGRTPVGKGGSEDQDQHPLATLNLTDFNGVSREVSRAWFLGDVERKIVAPSKHLLEDSDLLPRPKRVHLES